MFTLLFIAMLVAITVAWFLIQRLQNKPWTEYGVIAASQDDRTSNPQKVCLWAFIGVMTSLFLIFTGAYFMRIDSSHGGVPSGMLMAWVPIDEPPVLWLNTLLLVLASGALELARSRAHGASIDQLRSVFVGACTLTLLFLVGQVWAWQIVAADSELPRMSPAYSFFVLLTAVHGLHLLGGLLVLTRATARIWGGIDPADAAARARINQTIGLCATYWHYLLLVWLGLFIMLLST